MPNLTAKSVEALCRKAAGGEPVKEFTPDGQGLYLRIRKSGVASFWLRQSGFSPLKLCDADLGLAKARELSLQARASRASGVDPAEEKKAARTQAKIEKEAAAVAAVAPNNVAAIYDDYGRRYLRPKLRSAHAINLAMRREVLPLWGELPIGSITRHMVAKLVHDIADRPAPRAADLILSRISVFFRWAEGMGYMEGNPAERVPRPKIADSRERVLSDDELRLIWQACDLAPWPDAPFVRLLMISAQRKSEIGAGLWTEIDRAKRTWTLPKKRTKNEIEHTFPLSKTAMEIVSGLPRRNEDDRLFAGPNGGLSYGNTRVKQRLDKIIAGMNGGEPIEHWTWHDLRRTAATKMGDLGVLPHVIECCLNHVGGFRAGVGGVYNKSPYWAEMVDAYDRWDARLRVIVSGAENVVSFTERRA